MKLLFVLPCDNFSEEEFFIVKRILDKNKIFFEVTSTCNINKGNHNGTVVSSISLVNINANNFNGIILIGGKGIRDSWNNIQIHNIVKQFYKSGKLIAAICSSVVILANAKILREEKITCYPKDIDILRNYKKNIISSPLVTHNNIITANGPESATLFGDAIVKYLIERKR